MRIYGRRGNKMSLKKLRAIRALQGVSQDEIAVSVGISQAKLSRAERGYLQLTAEEKEKIAKVLDLKPEQLFY